MKTNQKYFQGNKQILASKIIRLRNQDIEVRIIRCKVYNQDRYVTMPRARYVSKNISGKKWVIK